jgi:NADH:ubiquinone oxidoreductase subunit 4 (subunit M)
VAEFDVLAGAWKAFPTFAVLAGMGIIIGMAFGGDCKSVRVEHG